MGKGSTLNQLAAKRKLAFLDTLGQKLQDVEKQIKNLQNTLDEPDSKAARKCVTGIRELAHTLASVGPVYGVTGLLHLEKELSPRVKELLKSDARLTKADLKWFDEKIDKLHQILKDAVSEAKQILSDKQGPVKSAAPKPPAVPWNSKEEFRHKSPRIKEPKEASSSKSDSSLNTSISLTAAVAAKTDSIRMKVHKAFQGVGFEVKDITDAESLLKIISEEIPELLVVDVNDPPPLGNSLITLLAKEPLTNLVPLLKLVKPDAMPARNAVTKPIDVDNLIQAAGKILGRDLLGGNEAEADFKDLRGISLLVADSDPKILDHFDSILSKAGLKVIKAKDGEQLQKEIENNQPDIIISDVFLPNMDGLALSSFLKWDCTLRHIPIILISSDENALKHIKDLGVQVETYNQKQPKSSEILNCLAKALEPGLKLKSLLSSESDVSGKIEDFGVFPVLKALLAQRPNSRLTLKESSSYFEAVIVKNKLASVTRTGTDGFIESSSKALMRLLCASSGSFAVEACKDVPKKQFADGSLDGIKQTAKYLTALNRQVADGALIYIEKIETEKNTLEACLKSAPPMMKNIIERLAEGKTPRELIFSAAVSARVLEVFLLDLISKGAVLRIVKSGLEGSAGLDTIPVSLSRIEQSDSLSNERSSRDMGAVRLTPPATVRPSPLWPIIAVILFVCFAAMVGLYVKDVRKGIKNNSLAAEKNETKPAIEQKQAGVLKTPNSVDPVKDPDTEKKLSDENGKPEKKAGEEAVEQKTEGRQLQKPDVETQANKRPLPADTGILNIEAPEDFSNKIRVSVAGKIRGKAPLKLRLSEGIHEIVFSYEERRTIKMVAIKAGEEKTIEAKVPQ